MPNDLHRGHYLGLVRDIGAAVGFDDHDGQVTVGEGLRRDRQSHENQQKRYDVFLHLHALISRTATISSLASLVRHLAVLSVFARRSFSSISSLYAYSSLSLFSKFCTFLNNF